MRKEMVGDVVIVVIDEIGELTFEVSHGPVDLVTVKDNETKERVVSALCEMLDCVWRSLPTCAAGFEAAKALDLLSRDFSRIVDRIADPVSLDDADLPF